MNKYGVHYNRREYRTEYLGSPDWRAKAQRILQRDPICRICDRNPSVDPHHLTYERLPFEDEERDLIGVCRKCHNRIHRHKLLAARKSITVLKWLFHASLTDSSLLIDTGIEARKQWRLRKLGHIGPILSYEELNRRANAGTLWGKRPKAKSVFQTFPNFTSNK